MQQRVQVVQLATLRGVFSIQRSSSSRANSQCSAPDASMTASSLGSYEVFRTTRRTTNQLEHEGTRNVGRALALLASPDGAPNGDPQHTGIVREAGFVSAVIAAQGATSSGKSFDAAFEVYTLDKGTFKFDLTMLQDLTKKAAAAA